MPFCRPVFEHQTRCRELINMVTGCCRDKGIVFRENVGEQWCVRRLWADYNGIVMVGRFWNNELVIYET